MRRLNPAIETPQRCLPSEKSAGYLSSFPVAAPGLDVFQACFGE
jgi:hypothetical protein